MFKNSATVCAIDFGKTADDYRQYRHGFPEAFFSRLQHYGVGQRDQKVLDIATGTGTVARGFAKLGCEVHAIDIAAPMLEQAKLIDEEYGVSIQYHVANAENTKLPSNYYNVVTVGQAWHWFNAEKAIAEVKRVLVKDGKLIIAHYDWIPNLGSIPALTEKIILKYNPKWQFAGGNGFYPKWVEQLINHGFETETFHFDDFPNYTHESWRGRIRASAGISASLSKEKVAEFDAEHAQALKEGFPQDPFYIRHRCFVVVAALRKS